MELKQPLPQQHKVPPVNFTTYVSLASERSQQEQGLGYSFFNKLRKNVSKNSFRS